MAIALKVALSCLALLLVGCSARPGASAAIGNAGDDSLLQSARPPSEIRPASVVPNLSRQIGLSRNGTPIVVRRFDGPALAGRTNQVVLIHAGIHGNEQTTVYAAERLIELLDRSAADFVPAGISVVIVPIVNPDGFAARTRQNVARVDLNRNFPAKNWESTQRGGNYWNGPAPLSEPESRALHDLVVALKPVRIVALHSIRPPRHGNNFDGPGRALAELLASHNKYNVLPTMGYPTPGSFGSWAGIDLQIPTITLEFPSNAPGPQAWKENREALLAFICGK